MKIPTTIFLRYCAVFLILCCSASCAKDSDIFNEVISESVDEPISEDEESESNDESNEDFEVRSFSFSPINDVFLQNSNIVNSTVIRIEKNQRTGYLMFNLAPIDSIEGEILSASLLLNPYGDQGNGILEFHKGTANDWDENNRNLADLPQKEVLLSRIEGQYRIGTPVLVDFQGEQINPEELTIIMEHLEGNDLAIASEEHPSPEIAPKLQVTYRVPRGADEIVVEDEEDPVMDDTEENTEEEETEEDSGTGTGTDADVLYWKEQFDLAWANQYPRAVAQSESKNTRQEYYFMGFSLDALTQVWQATGDNAYLNDALDLIENTIDDAVPVAGRNAGYLGWPSNLERYGEKRFLEGTNLWESFMYRYVATILRIMNDSPNLMSQSNYRSRYNTILEFTETHIWEKWYVFDGGNLSGIYRSRAHTASHWARMAMELYLITGEQEYIEVFENFSFAGMERYDGAHLRGRMYNIGEALVWNDKWDRSGIQDVDHGDDVMTFMITAFENGMYWNAQDMEQLVHTTNDLVWVSNSPLQFTVNIDGTGTPSHAESGSHGFIMAGRFDENLQARIRQYYTERTVSFQEPQAMGMAALNRKLLNDGRPVYPEN